MGRALLASLTLLDGTALVVCMFLCVEPSSFLTFEPILVEGCFFSYNDFRFSFCGYFSLQNLANCFFLYNDFSYLWVSGQGNVTGAMSHLCPFARALAPAGRTTRIQ